MKRTVFRRSPLSALISALTPVLFTLAIICVISYGLSQTGRSSSSEGMKILEYGLTRAAVTCYVVEGRYPDSVSYLEEQYGVRIDRSKYIVHYEVFASNILPEITVMELK